MKKNIPIILIILFSISGFSQSNFDSASVYSRIDNLNNSISSSNTLIQEISDNLEKSKDFNAKEINQLREDLNTYQSKIEDIKILQNDLNKVITGLKIQIQSSSTKVININNSVQKMDSLTNSIGNKVSSLNDVVDKTSKEIELEQQANEVNKTKIEGVSQSLSQKGKYGLIIVGVSIILILLVYILLNKKWNNETNKLNKKQKDIIEKQLEVDRKLTEFLQGEIDKPLPPDTDHSFAKRVADEIIRITTNLSRMDESIKGFKQLSASVRKLEQSLNSNHYEIEDLLNKPWDGGMNLQANFVLDENLKEDESIITRIIKPQINYKGKLIQAAQVEVSQGE